MGILYGLLAALCWGSGDYLITTLTRRVGTSWALVYIQVLSLIAWIGLLLWHAQTPHGDAHLWLYAIAAGVFHVLGLLLTYRAFEIGTLSLVSPIASGFAVVTAVLAIWHGEHPPTAALAGAALLLLGIILATHSTGHDEADKAALAGVPEAIGCAVAFGIMFWMMKPVENGLGTAWALIILKIMASSYALLGLALSQVQASRAAKAIALPAIAVGPEIASATRTEAAIETAAEAVAGPGVSYKSLNWGLALGAALADTLAWIAYNAGISSNYTTIVTAVASLFSVVTILLAWALLRERLARSQWLGVFVILLGVLLVSLYN